MPAMTSSSTSDAVSHNGQKAYHDPAVAALPVQHADDDVDDEYHAFNAGHTRNDNIDMGRMGKTPELRVPQCCTVALGLC
jgi:hypothetical protein